MKIHRLASVDAFIAFDFDDCRVSAGGTRLAPDVTEHEAGLLARAMTYKFGAIKRETGGAKGCVRGDVAHKGELMAAYCAEIKPLVDSFTFLTGPDLGTSEADFGPLRGDRPAGVMATDVGGVPIEDLLTGFGVVVAAETAMGSLDGMRFAIEGFGKVGGGVAREAIRHGAKVVAVSTIDGCVYDERGLDVEALLSMRAAHGDAFVSQFADHRPATALFDVDADVLVPGARTGVITAHVASRLTIPWIAPAANVPYTADSIDVMKQRRIRYLPDFVCNAGATIGYTSAATTAAEVFDVVRTTITDLMSEASSDLRGHYEGACAIAERFIGSWRGPDGLPPGPPLA